MEDYQKKAYFVEQSAEQTSLSRCFRKIWLRVHVPKRWCVSALARRVWKSDIASRSSGVWRRPDVARNLATRDHWHEEFAKVLRLQGLRERGAVQIWGGIWPHGTTGTKSLQKWYGFKIFRSVGRNLSARDHREMLGNFTLTTSLSLHDNFSKFKEHRVLICCVSVLPPWKQN